MFPLHKDVNSLTENACNSYLQLFEQTYQTLQLTGYGQLVNISF